MDAKEIIVKSFGEEVFVEKEPIMSEEDFSYYVKEKTGAFINNRMQSEKNQYPRHHSKFDIQETPAPLESN
ncbi:hypothetical protein [Neobacillus kokaensis]|uniref:hypothetical protein n=1 Tax=Neobacillus kokaensis TaxID=2759023 RepID=UPI001CB8E711|nr:hypothetical protein [Neobacillus kokaensis]